MFYYIITEKYDLHNKIYTCTIKELNFLTINNIHVTSIKIIYSHNPLREGWN